MHSCRAGEPFWASQYEGWPKTVHLHDNYARTATAWLPTLEVVGCKRPVVEVTQAHNALVYARRFPSPRMDLPVFADGSYTVRVSDPDARKTATLELKSTRSKGASVVQVTLE